MSHKGHLGLETQYQRLARLVGLKPAKLQKRQKDESERDLKHNAETWTSLLTMKPVVE